MYWSSQWPRYRSRAWSWRKTTPALYRADQGSWSCRRSRPRTSHNPRLCYRRGTANSRTKLRVLRLGLFQDGDVRIGIFPEIEKILICGVSSGCVAPQGVSAAASQNAPAFPAITGVTSPSDSLAQLCVEARVSSTGEEPHRPDGLFGCLKLHVLVDRKLRGRARGVVTGTGGDYMKATGTDLDLVGVRGTLPGNIRVVRREQIVERGVLALAGEVPALGRGDANQIAPYAGHVDGGLRVVRSGGSRRTLRLLGINVHPNGHYNDDAEKPEQAAHVYPRGNCTAKRDG